MKLDRPGVRRLPVFWSLFVAWTATGAVLFYRSEFNSPLEALPLFPWTGVWVVLCIAGLWRMATMGRKSWRRLGAVVIAGGAFVAVGPQLSQWALNARLHAEFEGKRPSYDLAVAGALESLGSEEGVHSHPLLGIYYVDAGPPLLVGFPTGRFRQHSPQYVVFDQTDSMIELAENRPELFGGLYLVSCKRVVSHYYRCWFD